MIDDCPYAEGKYHLYKATSAETSITPGDGRTYTVSVNNVTDLYIDGFEGDAYIPTKLSDAHSATFYIRDKNVAYSNGKVILYGTQTTTTATSIPLTLRQGDTTLKNGDMYRSADNANEYIYSAEDQK